MKTASTTEC